MDSVYLIFHLRPARQKARNVAVFEVLSLLRDLNPQAPVGGPLADQGGVFWITLPPNTLDLALPRLSRLGYTTAVDLLEPLPSGSKRHTKKKQSPDTITWRGQPHRLVRVFEEDATEARESAPDRRTFIFETDDGQIRPIKGYRGSSGDLSHRALPVCDARMLANLALQDDSDSLLDPFAGTGGILLEAPSQTRTLSGDSDPALRHGLRQLVTLHCLTDAAQLPYSDNSIPAIATEPPYNSSSTPKVADALAEMIRVLKPGGRIAMLCASHQGDPLRQAALRFALEVHVDSPVNRKGTECAVLVWGKQ